MSLDTFKSKWVEYHFADGSMVTSREVYWRNLPWKTVVKVVAVLRGNRHEVTANGKPGFVGFMNFRWKGMDHDYDPDTGEYLGPREINEWCIGWTDGAQCHLTYLDFKIGSVIKTTVEPLSAYTKHLHPDLMSA